MQSLLRLGSLRLQAPCSVMLKLQFWSCTLAASPFYTLLLDLPMAQYTADFNTFSLPPRRVAAFLSFFALIICLNPETAVKGDVDTLTGVKCGSASVNGDPIAHWSTLSTCSTGTQPLQALSSGISTQSFHGLLPDSCSQSGEATPLPRLLVSSADVQA